MAIAIIIARFANFLRGERIKSRETVSADETIIIEEISEIPEKMTKPLRKIQSIKLSGLLSKTFMIGLQVDFIDLILVQILAALGNYKIGAVRYSGKFDVLCTLYLTVYADRNRLIKFHTEVRNSCVCN